MSAPVVHVHVPGVPAAIRPPGGKAYAAEVLFNMNDGEGRAVHTAVRPASGPFEGQVVYVKPETVERWPLG